MAIFDERDFAGAPSSGGGFRFGPDRDGIVRALRKMLAAIEDGRALPQAFSVQTDCPLDDWVMQTFSFRFAERDRPWSDAERQHMAAAKVTEIGGERVPPGLVALPVEMPARK